MRSYLKIVLLSSKQEIYDKKSDLDFDELVKKLKGLFLDTNEQSEEVFYTAPTSPIEETVFIKG